MPNATISRLGIVGHEAAKFTLPMEAIARNRIRDAIEIYRPDHVISGGCHLGGIDIWAEEEARNYGIEPTVHLPKWRQWTPNGYKERNLKIAHGSDLVLVIVAQDYHKGYQGQRFGSCYHCRDNRPTHIKSGACWTAMRAKAAEWSIVPVIEE